MAGQYTNVTGAVAGDANGYLVSVDMSLGAYVLDATAPTFGARHVTCTRTVVDTADTPGTLVLVGVGVNGQPVTETLTVGGHTVVVTSTKFFRSLTSATSVGWAVDAAEGTPDTLEIGWDNVNVVAVGAGTLYSITVNVAGASAIYVGDARGKIANIPANQAAGSTFEWEANWNGYLRVETAAAASDVTVVHSGSIPLVYAI